MRHTTATIKKGKPFQVFCKDETLSFKGAVPVTIHNEVWWYLKKGSSGKEFALNKLAPDIHDFNQTIETSDANAPS